MNMSEFDSTQPTLPRPAPVGFWEAFSFWLKLGFVSFGGPAGQISVMHQELVEKQRWISERRFLHALNYCMLLPGPEAQQLAIYMGWLLHRTWGGIVAGTLFVLPSLFILMLLSWIYLVFGDVPWVAGIFYGVKPAITAIVIQAAHRIGSRVLKNTLLWLIAGASFAAIFFLKLPFPVIVVSAAMIGYLGGLITPDKFKTGDAHGKTDSSIGAALIDDDTPRLEHTLFRWSQLSVILLSGVLLWLMPMAILSLQYGWQHALTQMGWFFTKAALLTFGGAYAVLPYVYQGAVETYHWLTPQQMIDGLALGETTPGPLIMVVTFVGFVAGWAQALFGPEHLLLAGVAAACVVTYFTFLPSFLFILAGGPVVESTHGKLKFTAPLAGITAAVVGVILNLGLFFAWHVFWPQGLVGSFDVLAALVGLSALLALLRYKIGVIPVISAAGFAGLTFALLKPWLAQAGWFL